MQDAPVKYKQWREIPLMWVTNITYKSESCIQRSYPISLSALGEDSQKGCRVTQVELR